MVINSTNLSNSLEVEQFSVEVCVPETIIIHRTFPILQKYWNSQKMWVSYEISRWISLNQIYNTDGY